MSRHGDEPEVASQSLRSIMRRAAKGHADSFAALQELIDIRTMRRRSLKEATEAQSYARQKALAHPKLKVVDERVRELMEGALRGDPMARTGLVLIADQPGPAKKEAVEVLWFVNEKWKKNGWPIG